MEKFPKWKYHATEAACIVADEAAETELGDGWQDAPVEADEPTEEVHAKKRGRPVKAE